MSNFFWSRFIDDAISHPGWSISVLALFTTILGLAVSTFLTSANIEESTENDRRRFATELIIEWNQETIAIKDSVHTAFPDLIGQDTKNVGFTKVCKEQDEREGYWHELYWATTPEDVRSELRTNVVWMLNYFEAVGVAVDQNVANKGIIEGSLKNYIVRWYECFDGFVNEAAMALGYNPWLPLEKRVESWQAKQSN